MKRPIVRAIVVSWNGAHLLPDCLRALLAPRERDGARFELRALVIDNGSADGTRELLARDYPQVERLETGENLGYGRANNLGMQRALDEGADFALLVNNDVELEPGYLEALLGAAEAQPRAALLTGTLLFKEPPAPPGERQSPRPAARSPVSPGAEVINSTGLVLDWFLRATDRDIGLPREKLARADGPVDGVSGGAALLRVSALREVGLFDPGYFAYYEDVDLSLRARAAGWLCWYAGAGIARHRFGATFGPGSPRQRYLLAKNHLRTAGKHLPLAKALLVMAGTAAYRVAFAAPRELLRGRPALATAELRAAAEGSVAGVLARTAT